MFIKTWFKDTAYCQPTPSLQKIRSMPIEFWGLGSFLYFTALVFFLAACIQLLHLVFLNARLAFYKEKPDAEEVLPAVSVIIAARNEEDNLFEIIPLIAAQNYPNFEIIVVNNQSIDDSKWLLKAFQLEFANIRVVELGKNHHLKPGKKLPITLGIRAAKYEYLVLTDADCRPASTNWLRHMAHSFSDTEQIVLGYGPYLKTSGFLNQLIRFDTAWIGVSYFSMALANLPYMGVGRNLAYSKSVFEQANGFKSHYSIASGDDDLFIQEAAKKKNYCIQIHPDSHCYSMPEETWRKWFFQKSRHYSTSSKYNVIKKALLGIYPVSLLALWISFVILLLGKVWVEELGVIFLVILVVKWFIQGKCLFRLQEKPFAYAFPLWDLFYACLMPVLYLNLIRKPRKKW